MPPTSLSTTPPPPSTSPTDRVKLPRYPGWTAMETVALANVLHEKTGIPVEILPQEVPDPGAAADPLAGFKAIPGNVAAGYESLIGNALQGGGQVMQDLGIPGGAGVAGVGRTASQLAQRMQSQVPMAGTVESFMTGDLPQAAGSLAAGVSVAMIPVVGPAASATTFTLAGANEEYQKAVQAGATPAEAELARFSGALLGATNVIPLGKLFQRLGGEKVAGPMVSKIVQKIAKDAAPTVQALINHGAAEGAQEYLQELGSQLTEAMYQSTDMMDFWNRAEQALVSGRSLRAGLAGAITGAPLGAALQGTAPVAQNQGATPSVPLNPNQTITPGAAPAVALPAAAPELEQPPVPVAESLPQTVPVQQPVGVPISPAGVPNAQAVAPPVPGQVPVAAPPAGVPAAPVQPAAPQVVGAESAPVAGNVVAPAEGQVAKGTVGANAARNEQKPGVPAVVPAGTSETAPVAQPSGTAEQLPSELVSKTLELESPKVAPPVSRETVRETPSPKPAPSAPSASAVAPSVPTTPSILADVKPAAAPTGAVAAPKPKKVGAPQPLRTAEALAAYFKPGKVVTGYGGTQDQVVAFHPGDETGYGWSVEVREVNSKGEPVGPLRRHSTLPGDKELRAALTAENPLSALTFNQVKARAKELGVTGYVGKKRAEIERMIREKEAAPAPVAKSATTEPSAAAAVEGAPVAPEATAGERPAAGETTSEAPAAAPRVEKGVSDDGKPLYRVFDVPRSASDRMKKFGAGWSKRYQAWVFTRGGDPTEMLRRNGIIGGVEATTKAASPPQTSRPPEVSRPVAPAAENESRVRGVYGVVPEDSVYIGASRDDPFANFHNPKLKEAIVGAKNARDLVAAAITHSRNPYIKEINAHLLDKYGDILGKVRAGLIDSSRLAGLYERVDNTKTGTLADEIMRVNPNIVNEETIAHEAIHAVTIHLIALHEEAKAKGVPSGLTEDQGRAVEELAEFTKRITPDVKDLLGDAYREVMRSSEGGLLEPSEFVARALTDPRMQAVLSRIEYDGGTTLWSKLKSLIARVLNFGFTQGTALDKALDVSMRVLEKGGEVRRAELGLQAPTTKPSIGKVSQRYEGRADTLISKGIQPTPFKYAVVPQEDLVLSHRQDNTRNPDYATPKAQDREDIVKRGADILVGTDPPPLHPPLYIQPSITETGPPIVTGNTVLSGNGRTFALRNASPELKKAYVAYLREHASDFGIDPAGVDAIVATGKTPMLVRDTGDADVVRSEALGRALNIPATNMLSPREMATNINRSIPERKLQSLLQLDDDQSLADALNSKDWIRRFREAMHEAGQDTTLPSYYDNDTGKLTANGKDVIQGVFYKKVLGDTKVGDSLLADWLIKQEPAARDKVDRALAPLWKLQNTEGFDLVPRLADAVEIYSQIREAGGNPVAAFEAMNNQEDAFGGSPQMNAVKSDPITQALFRALVSPKKTALAALAEDLRGNAPGQMSKEDMFDTGADPNMGRTLKDAWKHTEEAARLDAWWKAEEQKYRKEVEARAAREKSIDTRMALSRDRAERTAASIDRERGRSRAEIIDYLSRELDLPSYRGTATPGAVAEYQGTMSRERESGDVESSAHEKIGHHLDRTAGLGGYELMDDPAANKGLQDVLADFRAMAEEKAKPYRHAAEKAAAKAKELEAAGDKEGAAKFDAIAKENKSKAEALDRMFAEKQGDPAYARKEAVGEFAVGYIQNPEGMRAKYPAYTKAFESQLRKANLLAPIQKAAELYAQNAANPFRNETIRPEDKKESKLTLADRFKEFVNAGMAGIFNDRHMFGVLDRMIRDDAGNLNIRLLTRPGALPDAAASAAARTTHQTDLAIGKVRRGKVVKGWGGVFDADGEKVLPSLLEHVAGDRPEVLRKFEDFQQFLDARHILTIPNEETRPTNISREDALREVQKYEKVRITGKGNEATYELTGEAVIPDMQAFVDAGHAYDEWRRKATDTLALLESGGTKSQQEIDAINSNNPHYVPLFRDLSAGESSDIRGGGGRSGGTSGLGPRRQDSGSPLKGSAIDRITQRMNAMYKARERNDMLRALAKDGRAIEKATYESTASKGGYKSRIGRLMDFNPPIERVKHVMELDEAAINQLQKQTKGAIPEDVVGELMGLHLTQWSRKLPSAQEGYHVYIDENGAPQAIKVNNKALNDAFLSMNPEAANTAMRVAALLNTPLRLGATTLNAAFSLGQFVKDTAYSMMTTQSRDIPAFLEAVKKGDVLGAKDALGLTPLHTLSAVFHRNPETYQKYLRSGAAMDTYKSMSLDNIEKSIRAHRDATLENVVRNPGDALRAFATLGNPLSVMQTFADRLDSSVRVAEFDQVLRKELRRGTSMQRAERIAAAAARESTIDFGKKGSWARKIDSWAPFTGVGLQSVQNLANAAKRNPAQFVAMSSLMAAVSAALYELNKDDKKYQELPQWEKDGFLYIPGGIRIPLPPFLAAVHGTVTRALRWAQDNDPQAFKNATGLMTQIVNPLGLTQNEGNPLPIPSRMLGPFMPIVETYTNKSFFFGGHIVPDSLENVDPELQFSASTSEAMKQFGELTGLSPMYSQHLLYGYTGGAGQTGLDILDAALWDRSRRPLDTGAQRVPVVSSFMSKTPTTNAASIQRFMEYAKDADRVAKSVKKIAQEKGENAALERAKRTPEDYALYRASKQIERTKQKISAIGRQVSVIRADKTLSPDEKRIRMDQLVDIMVDGARQANLAVEQIVKSQSESK